MTRTLQTLASTRAGMVGADTRLLVLTYHRVLESPDPFRPGEMTAEVFETHVRALARFFHVLPLYEALDLLEHDKLPKRSVCITFDDGYADNLAAALPILEKYELPATLFVATRYLDGGLMWHDAIIEALRSAEGGSTIDVGRIGLGKVVVADRVDERRDLAKRMIEKVKYLPRERRQGFVDELVGQVGVRPPSSLMLTSEQLLELAERGVTIGAHTHRHPILTAVPDEEAREEIESGKKVLEQRIGRRIELFAYPNGRPNRDYARKHVAMAVAAGFRAACCTTPGTLGRTDDFFQIPRIGPWAESALWFVLRLLRTYGQRPEGLVAR